MAQSLHFIPLNSEAPQDFDRKLVLEILSKSAVEPVRSYVCHYLDGSHGEAHAIREDESQLRLKLGFVHFGGRVMMERIFELADVLEVFLVWSDGHEDNPRACVTRAERLSSINPDAAFLRPVVARDASHLNYLVKGNTFEENGW